METSAQLPGLQVVLGQSRWGGKTWGQEGSPMIRLGRMHAVICIFGCLCGNHENEFVAHHRVVALENTELCIDSVSQKKTSCSFGLQQSPKLGKSSKIPGGSKSAREPREIWMAMGGWK